MNDHQTQAELWTRVYGAFPNSDQGPQASQRKVDRIAHKCILPVLGHPGLETYAPSTCDVREKLLTADDLPQLIRYHERTKHQGKNTPFVIVEIEGRRVVIEGNSRINAWAAGVDPVSRTALILTPRPSEDPVTSTGNR